MKRIILTLTLVLFIAPFAKAQVEQRYANGTATDQEGNTFEWINYGTQDWAIENAEVVTYRDGTPIPQVADVTDWTNLTTGAWCYYENDQTKGKLYNWYAVAGIHDTDPNTPNKAFAPDGWHIPTDAEWTTLEEYLIAYAYNYDGTNTNNKIAKAMASNSGWYNSIQAGAVGNDQSLNNISGFNAFPEGDRNYYGNINGEGFSAVFWTATEIGGDFAWLRNLLFNSSYLNRNYIDNYYGFSVRFVRDASADGAFDIILNGTTSAESNQIKNVADPTDAQDAVTKNYTYSKTEVDALIANLQQQINEMNQTITSSELEGNWNVKELYYLNPDTNEITSTFPTPECSKPYQYYEFLASKEIFWTGIGTNWVTQSCTSNEFGVKQDPYTITTENISGDDPITYINFPGGSGTRNWEVISRPSENTIIIRAWQNNEITLYNNEVYGLKLVKESRIE